MKKVVKSDDESRFDLSLESLISASVVSETGGVLKTSEIGDQVSGMLGLSRQYTSIKTQFNISCDVFYMKNAMVASSPKATKNAIVNQLLANRALRGPEGDHYGFVEFQCLDDHTVYGYFTQQYLDRTFDYDNDLHRLTDWNYKYHNLLVIWPLDSHVLILQDSKFFQAPTLNMSSTKNRITMLLTDVFKEQGVTLSGDVLLHPFERTVTKDEMLNVLLHSDQSVSEAELDIGKFRSSVPEVLPVFNPREDWNQLLSTIVNEYELPNISDAKFKSTKPGDLGKSKIVKLFALAGTPRKVTIGRGKDVKIFKKTVPTHLGKVKVSDPATKQEIVDILSFVRDGLKLPLSIAYKPSEEVLNIQFEMKFDQ
ncbi:hypothetical protein ABFB09_02875 [Dehalogenimonas sp. THU2]|uniref:hypothetical protein n=1 Tax=Dehalogenimonas sp. THU2 TaxID=3151121 RepID=UPI003218534F